MAIGYDFIRIKELEWQFNPQEVKKNLDEAIEKINYRLQTSKDKNKEIKLTKAKSKSTTSKTSSIVKKVADSERTRTINLPNVPDEEPVKAKPKKPKKGKSVRAKRSVKADPKTTIIKNVLSGLQIDVNAPVNPDDNRGNRKTRRSR